jgi:hypothetical protein
MTKDEALDLALEALESCEWGLGDQYFDALLVNKAITAIKQARSAPVQEPVAWMFEDDEGDKHKTFRQTPPSPEDVAYIAKWNRPAWVPLYTTPPAAQRPWTGLTDEEFEDIELGCRSTSSGKIEAMQKVEAKLKEKNESHRQHVTDGNPCWCGPETSYTNPETGASVIVHKEPQ